MGEPTEINAADAERSAAVRPAGSVTGQSSSDGARRTGTLHALRARLGEVRRFPARPRIWFELILIGVSYWLYSLVRNAVPERATVAQHHARQVWSLEGHLGIDVEQHINHAIDSVTWLIVGMNYYYATLHFIITIAVLVWVFRRHPGRYAAVRTALFVTTGFALVGFYFYPLAPPRLLTGGSFIDTVTVHHTWGSLASGNLASVSNQYAAMPSMHIGWSLWCGVTIAFLARRTWLKVLGMLYPLATLTVIVATANHFFMDAVGGILCLSVGFSVSRALYGRWAYRFPRLPQQGRRSMAGSRSGGTGGGPDLPHGHGDPRVPAGSH